jgi:hypothetical protein
LTSLHDSEQQRTPTCFSSGQVANQWNGQACNEVQTSSPRRHTKRQQQPSGYVAQSQERLRSERADSRPGARTPDGDSKRLLTSLGFDRNGLALLPLPKASITGSLYPLEWRRRRKHQRWRPIGVDSGGVQAWLDARASATGLTSHSARRPGQITQRVHSGDARTLGW